MHTLGKANWALPRWLDRHLPRLDLEGGEQADETQAARPLDPVAAP